MFRMWFIVLYCKCFLILLPVYDIFGSISSCKTRLKKLAQVVTKVSRCRRYFQSSDYFNPYRLQFNLLFSFTVPWSLGVTFRVISVDTNLECILKNIITVVVNGMSHILNKCFLNVILGEVVVSAPSWLRIFKVNYPKAIYLKEKNI